MNSAGHGTGAYRVRRINAGKDVAQIADLVELCFRPFLDPDGIAFIERMRSVAVDWQRFPFLSLFAQADFSITGYVCEAADGQIIGNVNLFPATVKNRAAFLIANVCVHPEYRKRGIAALMMREALCEAEKKRGAAIYLQVREETPEVLRMYQKLGFLVDEYRTGWLHPRKFVRETEAGDIRREKIRGVKRRDLAEAFEKWYPPDVVWNLNYDPGIFHCGAFLFLSRFFVQNDVETFRVTDLTGEAVCWIGFQPTNSFCNNLWVVPAQGCQDIRMESVLSTFGSRYGRFKPLLVSFPKGVYVDAFLKAGFFVHNRLVWMHKPL